MHRALRAGLRVASRLTAVAGKSVIDTEPKFDFLKDTAAAFDPSVKAPKRA